jgi:Protein of unknown function (DUF2599)
MGGVDKDFEIGTSCPYLKVRDTESVSVSLSLPGDAQPPDVIWHSAAVDWSCVLKGQSPRQKGSQMRTNFTRWATRCSMAGLASALGLAVLAAAPANAATASSSSAAETAAHAELSLTYATNAWWVYGPYGATLRITPSGVAQALGTSAAQGIMNNALGIAGWPPYSQSVYNSMFEQLQCHLLWRFKTPYDLDTWRPSVSWATEVHDECNPGYPPGTL